MAIMTNLLRNKLVDFLLRGQALTPPATFYIALVTTTSTAATAGTEVTGTGYARQAIGSSLANWAGTQGAGTTAVSSGTGGQTSNNASVNFGTAGSAWGTVVGYEIWDASSGGNRYMFGTITNSSGVATPRSIQSGDPVSFPVSALKLTFG